MKYVKLYCDKCKKETTHVVMEDVPYLFKVMYSIVTFGHTNSSTALCKCCKCEHITFAG